MKKKNFKKNVTCNKCNKRGHYTSDCRLLKKNPKRSKKSAMLGIWGDSDIPSSDEEKNVANLCLMANDDEVYLEIFF